MTADILQEKTSKMKEVESEIVGLGIAYTHILTKYFWGILALLF